MWTIEFSYTQKACISRCLSLFYANKKKETEYWTEIKQMFHFCQLNLKRLLVICTLVLHFFASCTSQNQTECFSVLFPWSSFVSVYLAWLFVVFGCSFFFLLSKRAFSQFPISYFIWSRFVLAIAKKIHVGKNS